jgi:CelD/BcsL family acetyltransferase involved in cellulose biosynthesis
MRSPAWLLNWWEIYGQHRALRVGIFRDGERLVGVLPLCARRAWHRAGIPFNRLEFLGADVDEGDGPCSEYLGLLTADRYEDIIAKQFVQNIDQFGPWHEIVLSSMNGDDPATDALTQAFTAAGNRVEQHLSTVAPYLTLPVTWDAYLKSLDRKKRYNLTRALRDFEAWAGADWAIEDARTPDELARGQSILRALHDQRWRDEETSAGAYASSRFAAFQEACMPALLADGKLDLFWLCVRGEAVAVHYQILANQKAYFYQCGRKMDLPPHLRIGIVMVAQAIQRAIRQGLREYDFLGGPALYKMQMTQTTRPIVQLRIARAGLRETLRRGADLGIGWARDLRNRYRAWRKPNSADVNLG